MDGRRKRVLLETYRSQDANETFHYGKLLAQKISEKRIVAFFGDLGAGKTTFIKGMASFWKILERNVTSPTFTYLNSYRSQGSFAVHHFDLYRLREEREFLAMGFQEYFFDPMGICLIEWAERIVGLLPCGTIEVQMEHGEEGKRNIFVFETMQSG